jgi:hypothetical protein
LTRCCIASADLFLRRINEDQAPATNTCNKPPAPPPALDWVNSNKQYAAMMQLGGDQIVI